MRAYLTHCGVRVKPMRFRGVIAVQTQLCAALSIPQVLMRCVLMTGFDPGWFWRLAPEP